MPKSEIKNVFVKCPIKERSGYNNNLVSLNACLNCKYAEKSEKDAIGAFLLKCRKKRSRGFIITEK